MKLDFLTVSKKLTIVIWGILTFCHWTAAAETASPARSVEQPNIVIFFIDDLGYTDLGCYGSEFYETPNIDGLAKRGIKFTDFYSAHPVCSPTRAALMTGKAPQRVGITQWINQPNDIHLPLNEVTIGEAFQSAGYQTGYIGKWHLGEKDSQMPTQQGFEWMRGVNRGGAPGSYFHPFKRNSKNKKNAGIKYWDVPDMDQAKPGDYLTDKLTDQSLQFITENKNKPFLLCFAHYAVHTPIQAPDKLVDKYKSKIQTQYGKTVVPAGSERNNAATRMRQDNPTYAAMVENLDTNVGRVLDHLAQLKLSEKTIVLFTSDNGGLSTLARNKSGGPTSVRPLRGGKGWNYEGGIRIPTFICWPGRIQPGVSSTPGITMDIYPTLLELAGLPPMPEQHLDGKSLVKSIKGQSDSALQDRVLAWNYPHDHGSGHSPSNAIRDGDWKLIHLMDKDQYELYNLKEDLSETKNLVEEFPDVTKQLSGKLKTWIEATSNRQSN